MKRKGNEPTTRKDLWTLETEVRVTKAETESITQTGARIVAILRETRAETRALRAETLAAFRRLNRHIDARAAHYNRLMKQCRRAARLGRPIPPNGSLL
ncbi:MAG: hypothetical protein HKL90_11060 [Elusimicrobia bacterium]|nr:hypothetical protein [Elusimicrobiota bacterium]